MISCRVLKDCDLIEFDLEISISEAVDLVTHPDGFNFGEQTGTGVLPLVIAVPHA